MVGKLFTKQKYGFQRHYFNFLYFSRSQAGLIRRAEETSLKQYSFVFSLTVVLYAMLLCGFLAGNHAPIGAVIHVGKKFARNTRIDSRIPICINSGGDGYDGQFSYRLALDPWYSDTTLGPRIVPPAYRHQRILYPLVVWMLSLGHRDFVPYLLVIVNLFALGLLSVLGAFLVKRNGCSPWWGLCFSVYPGFIFSVLHDLPEPVSILSLFAGLLLLRENRPRWAALAFSCSVLSRETTCVAMVVIACAGFVQLLRREKSTVHIPWYCGVVPLAVFTLWQMVLRVKYGEFSYVQGTGNFTLPLVSYIHKCILTINNFRNINNDFDLLLLAGFFWLVWTAITRLKTSLFHEKLIFISYVIFALFFSDYILEYRGGFLRVFSELYLMSVMIILGNRHSKDKYLTALWAGLFILTSAGYMVSKKLFFE
jgi:hypothetical protein